MSEDIKELRECPFCGEKPEFWSCDRLIKISCNKCNYHMSFDGIISRKKSDVPIHYEGGEISTTEFYHQHAEDEAVEVWNARSEIRAESKAKIIDEIIKRLEDELWIYYDNDYFSDNKDAMWKCNEVRDVLNGLKGETNG